jgi:hypothetical protein
MMPNLKDYVMYILCQKGGFCKLKFQDMGDIYQNTLNIG